MKTIRFSHIYHKMPFSDWVPNPDIKLKATLLEVFECNKDELSPEFIEYDTSYYEEQRDHVDIMEGGKVRYSKHNYPLPTGKLLILLLQTVNESGAHLWTTVRRSTPEKKIYYRSMRGKQFECVVEAEK